MARWVLLRHTLPEGGDHLDWLIEDPDDPSGRLLAFRLAPTVPWPPTTGFDAERLKPHRRDFLTYEGPLSGNRGEVRRIAGGECRALRAADGLSVCLGPVERPGPVLAGRPTGSVTGDSTPWRFDLES